MPTNALPISCVTCNGALCNQPRTLCCAFATTGFLFSDGTHATPCGNGYHQHCIWAGDPFTSRRNHSEGLHFPKFRYWPIFICEACTVRAVADRELVRRADDVLLCLERMRILDLAHNWAKGTHAQYQSRLHYIRHFERSFDIHILQRPLVAKPPCGPEIPLMWLHEFQCLSTRRGRRRDTDLALPLQFNTIRALRSAVSYYESLQSIVTAPHMGYLDQQRNFLHVPTRFTDSAAFTYFSNGFKTRIGDNSNPSTALLFRHIDYLDRDLDARYRVARTDRERCDLTLAGLANLILWLAWLRSRELFTLRWCDLDYLAVVPDAPAHFPPVSAFLLRLLPETKSSPHRRADVLVAGYTYSGLNLDRWYHRAISAHGLTTAQAHRATSYIFCSGTTLWTSFFFRHRFLYPSLFAQQASGDPLLNAFDDTPGNRIPDKFWALHSYRRGARSSVSKRRTDGARKVSTAQVYEHGRWRLRRSGEPVDVMYREWTFADRLELTLFSM